MNEVINRLHNEGWAINELKMNNFLNKHEIPIKYDSVKHLILENDIKNYGSGWLDIANKTDIHCNGIIQVNRIRNVAAPEIDQDNKNYPTLNKYLISDGVTNSFILDLNGKIKSSGSIELGSKMFIKGNMPLKNGMMILDGNNIIIRHYGGKVLDLIKTDSVFRSDKNNRNNGRGDGAPKFLPFGNKLNININDIKKFKTMNTNDANEKADESTEFGNQREAEILKAKKELSDAQDKSDLLNKFHSGGKSTFIKNTMEKQDLEDNNLAVLMRQGFGMPESKKALNVSNNDLNAAIDYLLQSKTRSQLRVQDEGMPRGKSQKARGRGKADPEEDDPWFDPVKYAERMGLASRPNRTMNLSDLMPGSKSDNQHSTNQSKSSSMIYPGYKCQAQIMDGSYRDAVVLEILPNRCLRIRYLESGEEMETEVLSMRGSHGEKLQEHMVPHIDPVQQRTQSANYYNNDQHNYNSGRGNYRGRRGRGGSGRRRGGRY